MFIEGEPAGQGSKVQGRYGQMYEASKKLKPWRKTVRDQVRMLIGPNFTPYEGPLGVAFDFYFTRPKSVKKDVVYKATSPDTDKLARAVNDALTESGIWTDDKLVADLRIQKRFCDDDHPAQGVHIFICNL